MGVASLVLGIISLVFVLIPPLWLVGWIGAIVGVIGIVLGALGRKNAKAASQPTGSATAGLVMSIIGTILSGIIFAACATAMKKGADMMNDPKLQQEFQKSLEKSLEEHK